MKPERLGYFIDHSRFFHYIHVDPDRSDDTFFQLICNQHKRLLKNRYVFYPLLMSDSIMPWRDHFLDREQNRAFFKGLNPSLRKGEPS